MMIGPRQIAGASRSTRKPSDMSLHAVRLERLDPAADRPEACSKTPNIRGMLGP